MLATALHTMCVSIDHEDNFERRVIGPHGHEATVASLACQ
jgi:hypothetical protein